MIRREFLKNAAVLASGLAAKISHGAPCPPLFDVEVNEACEQSNLERRTRDLADGAFFNSNDGGSPEIPNAPRDTAHPYTWQNRSGFYDPIRRRAHVIGEAYEAGDPYEHHYFDEINNVWVTANITAVPQGASHWRGGCYDESSGRFFWQREATDNVYWYDPDINAWALHSSHAGLADTASSPWTTGFHPNLFGPGKPGLVHANIRAIHAFEFTDYLNDPTAGSWSQLNSNWSSGNSLSNTAKSGSATYIPDRDEVMITGREDGPAGVNCIVIHAGAGLLSNLANGNGLSIRTATPIEVAGNSGGSKCYICVHPRKRNRILIMSAADSRTWYSDNGGQTWPSGPSHPFAAQLDNTGKMSVTALPHHEVVMGITHISSPAGKAKCCFWRAPL